jgi:hypothetical protein
MSDADSTAAGEPAADSSQAMLVRVPVGGMNLIADLAPVSRAILGSPGRSLPPELARLPLRDEAGLVRGEFFVIEIGMGGERALELHMLAGVVRLANP